jgi:hypothetical protein
MATTVNALRIRKLLGPTEWMAPESYGPDGWCFGSTDFRRSIIVSAAWMDGAEWIHASIAYSDHVTMPNYYDMALLHRAVFDEGFAYQVFSANTQADDDEALHLFGRSDGKPVLPEFGNEGMI